MSGCQPVLQNPVCLQYHFIAPCATVRQRQCQHHHDLSTGGFMGKRFGFSSWTSGSYVCSNMACHVVYNMYKRFISKHETRASLPAYRNVLGTEGLMCLLSVHLRDQEDSRSQGLKRNSQMSSWIYLRSSQVFLSSSGRRPNRRPGNSQRRVSRSL